MRFIRVLTRPLLPPQDDIYPVLDKSLPRLQEGDVLFITSKVLAIHQGRCVKIGPHVKKDRLVKREAERYAKSHLKAHGDFILTIKDHTLIPSAGVDESNGQGYYILWPKRTSVLLRQLCRYLKKKFKLRHLAVIATDSHTIPLRYGVVGISIGCYGLEPLHDYRGQADIFGRKLKHTRTNIVDALSAMAVLLMGEGSERTPIVILRKAKGIKFTTHDTYQKLTIPPKEDLYHPLFKAFRRR